MKLWQEFGVWRATTG